MLTNWEHSAGDPRGGGRMLVHTIFDLLAWLSAGMLGWWIGRQGWLLGYSARPRLKDDPYYFLALGLGAMAGAILFGSVNLGLAGYWTLGHSIAGAIAGGAAAVELYKGLRGI